WAAFVVLVTMMGGHHLPTKAQGKSRKKATKKREAKTPQAWTVDEAMAQLQLTPRDAYLQYVALQLARRANHLDRVVEKIERLTSSEDMFVARQGRRPQVDLFSLFTGALAVQESLQLDTMRGNTPGRRDSKEAIKDKTIDKDQIKNQPKKRPSQTLAIARLKGPSVKSHPWKQMLGREQSKVSSLSRAVPDDFYLAEFRSLTKLLDMMDINDLWAKHLFNQAVQEAWTQPVGARLKKQLVLETSSLFRQFYDQVVDEVAVTGSDLYLREGSDVTLLFRLSRPEIFKARMEAFAKNARKRRPDVTSTNGKFLGIDYQHLSTADREVSVYAAYPEEGLHVRSNSKAAFQRILEAIQGKTAAGQPVRRLGETEEFKYIRRLMPRGAKEEDGFVYLSDPFIRRLVGPQLKLTERRRMLCFNHLKMIGHASLMYRTEHGQAPKSLAALAPAECSPRQSSEGQLSCPWGGTYTLSPDGMSGICSKHGNARFLTPCAEIPLAQVTRDEASEYDAFVKDYNQYWKTYFDPIALRIQITPTRYRVE